MRSSPIASSATYAFTHADSLVINAVGAARRTARRHAHRSPGAASPRSSALYGAPVDPAPPTTRTGAALTDLIAPPWSRHGRGGGLLHALRPSGRSWRWWCATWSTSPRRRPSSPHTSPSCSPRSRQSGTTCRRLGRRPSCCPRSRTGDDQPLQRRRRIGGLEPTAPARCDGTSPGAEVTGDLLAALPTVLSAGAVAATSGEPRPGTLPQISLSLDVHDCSLLHDVHRMSDWVISLHPHPGHRVLRPRTQEPLSTSSMDRHPQPAGMSSHVAGPLDGRSTSCGHCCSPYCGPALSIEQRHVRTFFDQLRELSEASPSNSRPWAKLAAPRWWVSPSADVHRNNRSAPRHQLLVPLDAHPELYGETEAFGGGRQRGPVASNRPRPVRPGRRTQDHHLPIGGGQMLYRFRWPCVVPVDAAAHPHAARQHPTGAHRAVDPSVRRSDRPLQNVTLRTLLGHYLSRADRYGLLSRKSRRRRSGSLTISTTASAWSSRRVAWSSTCRQTGSTSIRRGRHRLSPGGAGPGAADAG